MGLFLFALGLYLVVGVQPLLILLQADNLINAFGVIGSIAMFISLFFFWLRRNT